MRRPFVAGNWKMNLDRASAAALVADLAKRLQGRPAIDVAVCPPAVYLSVAFEAAARGPIRVGAQNLWPEPNGAFTGEISAAMIKDVGGTLAILGHSERRHTIGSRDPIGLVRGEDDAVVNRKVRAAIAAGLMPIFCVGETLRERDDGRTFDVLQQQIELGLAGVTPDQVAAIVIAYEPVWAIGTGRNATPQQADEVHQFLRSEIATRFGPAPAASVRILYGGSVKPSNAAELMRSLDVDGALVGGASLVADDFWGIIQGCLLAKGLR